MNKLIDLSRHIPAPDAAPTVAYTPITLPMEGRQPLELRITAPVQGTAIPIVLLSHGHGPSNYIASKDGYAHLAQFWAERGFAVIQPTHASSHVAGLPSDAEGAPFFWRERVTEMKTILDRLDEIMQQAPAISGRLDPARVAAVGHSLGGYTTSLLLGTNVKGEDFRDPRISAGILLTAPGRGGSELTPESAERFPFFEVDFSTLTTRALVVCGDADQPHFTTRGPDWFADSFHDGPGAEALLTMHGVGHGLGGIASLDAKETEAEVPDVLEATKRLTLAWLRDALGLEEAAWRTATDTLDGPASALARVTSA
ncbi:alpha/beta hydrolase family protein [Pelagovum pacificum]|uniref:Dienelactone hydrolase n=1 Tax=Pelagovum pacificum TaxID=2588711 RepID=A0A5C5GBR4_9RHOB|nr:alpha/beta fold hydrolase [Pelagovum pacificum]QQA44708.1 alpha/beta fold hydrolase [Pelagovum pacificum]TNY32183.1 dienelactone hydrolase [Pelagovum pacificum]